MIAIRSWGMYLIDLNPPRATKPGKVRPCICVQPDHFHDLGSSVILPLTSHMVENVQSFYPLRIRIPAGVGGLEQASDVLVDQLQAWDHRRFVTEIGFLPVYYQEQLRGALREFLDL